MSQTPQAAPHDSAVNVVSTLPPRRLRQAAGTIADDRECLICGASLRGLPGDGRCPTCGAAVGRSIAGNFLKFAQPAYVRDLAEGVVWLFRGALTLGIVIGVAQILAFGAEAPGSLLAAATAGVLMLLPGIWAVTASEPNAVDAAWRREQRRSIRRAWAAAAVLPVVLLLTRRVPPVGWAGLLLAATTAGLGAAAVIGCRLLNDLLAALALRLPDPSLQRNTRRIGRGLTGAAAAVVALRSAALLAAAARDGDTSLGALDTLTYLAWLALTGCLGAWLILLIRHRRGFVDQATAADQSWAHAPIH